MANYNTIDFDLATTISPARLVIATTGKEIESLTVLALPPGQTAYVRLGGNDKDRVRLVAGYLIEFCPPERKGVFIEVPAGGAGTLTLHFSFVDSGEEGEGGATVAGA